MFIITPCEVDFAGMNGGIADIAAAGVESGDGPAAIDPCQLLPFAPMEKIVTVQLLSEGSEV